MPYATWDPFRAELFDTIREHRDARQKKPCLLCGAPTKSLSQVCCLHPIGPDDPASSRPDNAAAISPVPPRRDPAGRAGAASGAPAPPLETT